MPPQDERIIKVTPKEHMRRKISLQLPSENAIGHREYGKVTDITLEMVNPLKLSHRLSNWWLTICFQPTDLFNNTDIFKWNLLPIFKILEQSNKNFNLCWFFRTSGSDWSFISSKCLWARTELLSSVSSCCYPVIHHSHSPLSLPSWQSAWFTYHSFPLYPALNHYFTLLLLGRRMRYKHIWQWVRQS